MVLSKWQKVPLYLIKLVSISDQLISFKVPLFTLNKYLFVRFKEIINNKLEVLEKFSGTTQ